MIRRLAHLCFNTDQLEAMRGFYAEALGLPVKFLFKNKEGEIFGYYFDCGDSSYIEVFDRVLSAKQWGAKVEEKVYGNQYKHFCLEVTGLAEVRKKLIERGLKVSELRRGMDHSWQAWTGDPDGNAIELMEYTAESLQIQRTAEPAVAT